MKKSEDDRSDKNINLLSDSNSSKYVMNFTKSDRSDLKQKTRYPLRYLETPPTLKIDSAALFHRVWHFRDTRSLVILEHCLSTTLNSFSIERVDKRC